MRRLAIMRTCLVATVSLMALAAPAAAQVKAPFMESLPFTYEGQIGGLDAWSLPGEEDLWLVLPDGQTVIAGFVFNGRGNDIGSAMLGLEPVHAAESLQRHFGGTSSSSNDELRGAIAPLTSQAALETALEDTMIRAYPDLEKLSDEDRDALLVTLVDDLDAAQSPQEFQETLLQWYEMVTGASLDRPAIERAGETDADPGSLVRVQSAIHSGAVLEALAQARDSAPEPEDGSEFLRELEVGTMWFGVGRDDALPIYMVYDPSCPFCARAVQNLEPRIVAGEIQLRIIMAPAVSQSSLGLASAILADADPVGALLENSSRIARGGQPSMDPVDPATLDQALLEGIAINIDMLERHNVPGVPFFGWADSGTPRFFAGVPDRAHAFIK